MLLSCRSVLASVHVECQRLDVASLKLAICNRSTLEIEREEHLCLEDIPLGSVQPPVMIEREQVDVRMQFRLAEALELILKHLCLQEGHCCSHFKTATLE